MLNTNFRFEFESKSFTFTEEMSSKIIEKYIKHNFSSEDFFIQSECMMLEVRFENNTFFVKEIVPNVKIERYYKKSKTCKVNDYVIMFINKFLTAKDEILLPESIKSVFTLLVEVDENSEIADSSFDCFVI